MGTDVADTLYLEVNGELVEVVKVFGKTDEARVIEGLKKAYHLTTSDNYLFYYKKQSLMNGKTESQISSILRAKEKFGIESR